MKTIIICIAVSFLMLGCQPDYTIETCETGIGKEIVCVEYRYDANEDLTTVVSAEEYQKYLEIKQYLIGVDARPDVLAQAYADAIKEYESYE